MRILHVEIDEPCQVLDLIPRENYSKNTHPSPFWERTIVKSLITRLEIISEEHFPSFIFAVFEFVYLEEKMRKYFLHFYRKLCVIRSFNTRPSLHSRTPTFCNSRNWCRSKISYFPLFTVDTLGFSLARRLTHVRIASWNFLTCIHLLNRIVHNFSLSQ